MEHDNVHLFQSKVNWYLETACGDMKLHEQCWITTEPLNLFFAFYTLIHTLTVPLLMSGV